MESNTVFLEPIAILGGVALIWYVIIKYITDYLLKKKMIEKGYVTDEEQALFKKQSQQVNSYSSLKWGLIILFGGLALVAVEFIPYAENSPLPFGVFAIAIAVGFLIYYSIVKKETKQ
ncbi:hypothetical protein E1176_05045 [Fulvivirga sp. RKSG066]|uniref:DUF6249 domain-containing protein n=1 Tax=Fulvivirga aurantia TaxID=2529383 RepID=UPI0012BC02B2|nr:DUF6249 domain-containing protein [Fulvivirga aurantia]MTI20382.1 hypothetical protein [Fulvivirga aurantia]